ncbi:hypothetical protein TNCV_1389531 [Trichonephila clavipes]|nr:hypothetical protein TNCV_1389531 [Trichonephila clavipes]
MKLCLVHMCLDSISLFQRRGSVEEGDRARRPSPTSVSWAKRPSRTTQPTSRIGALTSTFVGLKEDTCTKDSLAADQR